MSERAEIPARAERASPRRRGYRSVLREQRAADTRQRIVAAAGELFAERGFAATTVPAIAERAGVSQPTVYAVFGSKCGIIAALMRLLEDEADAAGWRRRLEAEPDAVRRLTLFACWSRQLYGTGRALITAMQHARGEPGIVELHAQGDRNRRDALAGVVGALDQAGLLRPGLDAAEALDRAWMLTGFELYLRATDGCGWTDEAYERWLAGLLYEQLCRTDAGAASTEQEW